MADSNPTVVVTGVSGNFGLRLLQQLTEFEVIGVDVQHPKTNLPLRFVQMDLGQEESCRELFLLLRESGASAVIHLAFVLDPVRTGRLSVVNAFGAGVADDKAIHPHVEDIVRFYLGEEPLLPSVRGFDLCDRDAREEALDRLDELVIKPRTGHGGAGVVIGAHASAAVLSEVGSTLQASPDDWVVQETVQLSRHPTAVGGRLEPRHVDLRAFAIGPGAAPGGLTRVALEPGSLIVNSSKNGGGKDTWVLS